MSPSPIGSHGWRVCGIIAVGLLVAAAVGAVTPLSTLRYTPDITTTLSGTTVGPTDVAEDNLAGVVSLVSIGAIANGAHLDGYAVAPSGDQLLSFDTALILGGTTFQRNDVVRYNGSAYTLEFSGSANGVPESVDVKDIALHGANLLLTFDSAFAAGGTTFYPWDVAEWDGSALTKFLDGAAAGVPDGLVIDGLHLLPNGHLLLSFDTAGTIAGIAFNHEDIAEYTPGSPGTWEPAYVGAAAQPSGWGAADLSAFSATAGSNTFDVALSLFGPASVGVNAVFSYAISVTNLGPQAATALTVSDALPAGVLFQALAAPPGWVCSTPAVNTNGTVSCASPNLAPGLPQNFAITVAAPAAPATLSDTATVTSNPADTNLANNSKTAQTTVVAGVVTGYNVAIVKTATPAVAAGATITYTVVATNSGPDAATNLTVADTLPAGVLFQSLAAPAGWTCSAPAVGTNGTVSCTLASLAIATPQSFVILATAPNSSTVISNTATILTDPQDQNASDDSSTARTRVGQIAGEPIPLANSGGLALLALLLAGLGWFAARRGAAG